MKTYLLLTLFFCSILSYGQVDTINLSQDKLGIEDIRITADEIAKNQMFTASRTINKVDELPYSVYIVTGEEILRNGYFTLTDVLKSVPGIFVSQPGSAIEGETFVMNGMHGNTHAKILINNLPVITNNVLSVPIGAQLPIRQAERIEITYGPSGIEHGTDSGAGVINIITRTSDRPVYTHADLGLGSSGYSSVNVLFGGKLGKNKRILKFSAYGSSTEKNSINLFSDGATFRPDSYPINSFVAPLNNGIALRGNVFPHASRQVGLNLEYKTFSFSLARMSRKDHAALGSNPLAIRYDNPQTTFGESILNSSLTYKQNFKRFGLKTEIQGVYYQIDSESSFEYDQPYLKQLYNFAADASAANNPALRDEFIENTALELFDGRRYVRGDELAVKFEQTISFFPLKNLELILGANNEILVESPFTEYLLEEDRFTNSRSNILDGNTTFNTNTFAIGYWTFNKMNIIVGLNQYIVLPSVPNSATVSKTLPRFAALYKFNSKLQAHASYSTSYKVPGNYLYQKFEQIEVPELGLPPTGERGIDVYEAWPLLAPQETTYADLGIRYKANNKVRMSLTAFRSSNENLIHHFQDIEETELGFQIQTGFTNRTNLTADLTGIRASIEFENITRNRQMDLKIHYSYFNGEQDLPSGEKFPHVISQPEFILQTNLSFRLFKKLFMTIENVVVGQYASRSLETLDQYYIVTRAGRHRRGPNIYTDITFNLPLNNNFNMFLKYGNILGGQTTGIDATGSPDDLNRNLQQNNYVRGGVSYTIN